MIEKSFRNRSWHASKWP